MGHHNEKHQSASSRDAASRARFERRLREEFLITTAFVPVRTVAKVLGFPTSTLHQRLRENRFFLPCVKLGRIPMVAVEDLVDWYCERSDGRESNDPSGAQPIPRFQPLPLASAASLASLNQALGHPRPRV